MKTNTLKLIVFLTQILVIALVFGIQKMEAQVQNNRSIYIHDQGEAYIASGAFNFGNSPATSATSRTASIYGVLSFGPSATTSGASDSHYLDGYARYYGTAPFLLPIGQSGFYAPIQITASSNSGVDGAYIRSNPSLIGTALGFNVSALSSIEYWDINSSLSTAAFSLTWRASSNVNSLSTIIIVGYNGTAWVEIPSVVDVTSVLGGASTIASGSITTSSAINFNTYSFFALGTKGGYCDTVTSPSGTTKTWSGTWSPSAPTLADVAVINAPYSGNLNCNSLILNADVTLNNGQLVEIIDGVTGTGKIIMSSEASVVQHNSLSNAPNIELTKLTNPMRRYDYVFLSNPTNNETSFFSQILNKNNAAVNGSFGTYAASAFDQLRTYDVAGLAATNANAANTPLGRGFSATVRNQVPYAASTTQNAWYTEKYPIQIKTTGVANNGNVSVTVPSSGWCRIGNPYPSAISGEKLLDATGSNVRKTIYYWTFNTPRATINNNSPYNNGDFATWNYSGGVAACPTCDVPTGIIASMQSVLMKASNATATTFDITNCMRETAGNDNFFRTASTNPDRYWVNLSGTTGSFSQILVAYNPNATNGDDSGYDALRISGALSSELSSLIGANKYAIQTRAAFTSSDAVPLQVNKNVEESFAISLGNKEGVFNDGSTIIVLHDTLLGVYHNLQSGPYTFIQTLVNDANRFEIVYQQTLNNNNFNLEGAVALINNQMFQAQTKSNMVSIQIFDITGRLVQEFDPKNATFIAEPFHHAQGTYIAKIKLESGLIATQKVINQ